MRQLITCLLLLSVLTVAGAVETLPVEVPAGDAHLRFSGRWDHRDAAGPRCAWPACAVLWRMRGSAVTARLSGQAGNALQIVVDGAPAGTLVIADGHDAYPVASGLAPGEHTVELWKRTEAFCGVVQFKGLGLDAGGALVELPLAKHRIEFIGDSITAGYGNEAASKEEHFTPATENAWATWGVVAARALGAEVSVEAWSGIWLTDNGKDAPMPKRWEQTLPNDPGGAWQPDGWKAEAVVIDLGTNDGNRPIDEQVWAAAYRAFIARLRQAYPQCHVFLAIGPMGYGPKDCIPAYNERLAAAYAKDGDARVHAVKLPLQRAEDGIGADWHPSVRTHAIMAEAITRALKAELHW